MKRMMIYATDGLIISAGTALLAVLYLGILWESGVGIDSLDRVAPIYLFQIAFNLPRGGIVLRLRRYYRRQRWGAR